MKGTDQLFWSDFYQIGINDIFLTIYSQSSAGLITFSNHLRFWNSKSCAISNKVVYCYKTNKDGWHFHFIVQIGIDTK